MWNRTRQIFWRCVEWWGSNKIINWSESHKAVSHTLTHQSTWHILITSRAQTIPLKLMEVLCWSTARLAQLLLWLCSDTPSMNISLSTKATTASEWHRCSMQGKKIADGRTGSLDKKTSSSKSYINPVEATAKLCTATKEHLDLSENIK